MLQLPTVSDIETRFVAELRKSGLTYFSENSKGRALAKILSREIVNAGEFHAQTTNKAFAKYAEGDLLEAICWLFGLSRELATKAVSYSWELNQRFYVSSGTFGDINAGADITIPAGTTIFSSSRATLDEDINYTTTSEVILDKDDSEGFVSLEAIKEGSRSNIGAHVLREHDFASYTDFANETLLTRNAYAIVNGQDREGDGELRFRLSIAATAMEAANSSALQYQLLQVAGVRDLKIIPYYDGIGTTAAFLVGQGNEAPPSMVIEAQEVLSRTASNAVLATAYAPPQVGVAFTTQINMTRPVTVNEQNEIATNLASIISSLFNDLRIGASLNLSLMRNLLVRVDSRIASFGQDPNTSPFDSLYIYRTSDYTGDRIRFEWLNTNEISIEDHEVIVPESSLVNPITFTWQVYE
tara:strand:+ start:5726 stop:6964 length:1239 start_codon:yes stop_codon:yes gene_type:complete